MSGRFGSLAESVAWKQGLNRRSSTRLQIFRAQKPSDTHTPYAHTHTQTCALLHIFSELPPESLSSETCGLERPETGFLLDPRYICGGRVKDLIQDGFRLVICQQGASFQSGLLQLTIPRNQPFVMSQVVTYLLHNSNNFPPTWPDVGFVS